MHNRTYLLLLLFLAVFLVPCAQAAPLDWTFTVVPPNISGPPGSTIGWGYSITNLDPTNWLLLNFLDADVFLFATPTVVFDFPLVMPATTVALPFNQWMHYGLYQLDINPLAPLGFVNSGTFTVTGDFYDGNPFGGGSVVESNTVRSAAYSATVSGAAPIPEPATVSTAMTAILFAAVGFVRKRRN